MSHWACTQCLHAVRSGLGAKYCPTCGEAVEWGEEGTRATDDDSKLWECERCGEICPGHYCVRCGYEICRAFNEKLARRREELEEGANGDQLLFVSIHVDPEDVYVTETVRASLTIGIRKIYINGRVTEYDNLLRSIDGRAAKCWALSEESQAATCGGTDRSRFPRKKSRAAATSMLRMRSQTEPSVRIASSISSPRALANPLS